MRKQLLSFGTLLALMGSVALFNIGINKLSLFYTLGGVLLLLIVLVVQYFRTRKQAVHA